MRTSHGSINLFFLFAVTCSLAWGVGCKTAEEKKQATPVQLRVFMETPRDLTERQVTVPVFRASPTQVTIDKIPFLDESSIAGASIVDDRGGYSLQLQFNQHGTRTLDSLSLQYRNKRMVVFSSFLDQQRWLAAPRLSKAITNGIVTIVPDATREEVETIVAGLNKAAKKNRKIDPE